MHFSNGLNKGDEQQEEWILSPQVHVSKYGTLLQPEESEFILLDRTSPLCCRTAGPVLDSGEALTALYLAIERFMPDNAMACLAAMAGCAMGAAYEPVMATCGQMGIPFLFGDFGSCKSQATLCALSIFGAHTSHCFNNQTTPSYLFDAMKQTTIPVAVDDISEKAKDTWEELIVDVYNNTPRGTRSYSVERFLTTPLVSANWMFPNSKGRAFT